MGRKLTLYEGLIMSKMKSRKVTVTDIVTKHGRFESSILNLTEVEAFALLIDLWRRERARYIRQWGVGAKP